MKNKNLRRVFPLFLILTLILFLTLSRQPQAHSQPADEEISAKLDKLLENQDKLFKEIESLKEQLYLIQLRCS